ncbi:MAG: dihydroorotate dehydrogenase-like protein [Desulfobacter sp.]|jgi:dihydroorotate dehydrogenase (fumarate)|uniref:dihydroorotate dehydrogenase-like protein n=1 Tax=uncultured Desulfobacter sp. TaxID=240139 RepID=UPI0029C76D56|nr:dihydroorotate dehydrogenase-like protein [uncultured Desulfobacter sp.]MCW8801139.1 dihydroorotate dehydrogenase-like protein [Desulfobacter sp.]
MDLSTTYLGLPLKNPVIVGSSGLTDSPEKIKEWEKNGAAAVVLKSLFEEEIIFEYEEVLKEVKNTGYNMEQFDYYDFVLKKKKLDAYLALIEDAKKAVSIPVIASVNCVYSHEWTAFADKIQDAGADAIELNMFFLPSDMNRTSQEMEERYLKVINALTARVSIPVSVKISYHFSSLGQMIKAISDTGVSGMVLFNRFFNPDIDIERLEIKPSFVFSAPSDIAMPLRWIALMYHRVNCDLAASTGVHDGDAVIKQILAGARAVQVVSALYKNRTGTIPAMLDRLTGWMGDKGYGSLSDFRGKLSHVKAEDPAVLERVQFMKYYA